MKLILEAIKSLFRKVEAAIASLNKRVDEVKAVAEIQSDWNQHDPEGEGYIQNRTHYYKPPVLKDHLLEEQTLTGFVPQDGHRFANSNRDDVYCYDLTDYVYAEHGLDADSAEQLIEAGTAYTVVWAGVEYECIASEGNGMEAFVLGNKNLASNKADSGEPFCIVADVYYDTTTLYIRTSDPAESHTVGIGILKKSGELKRLDEKYIPENIKTYISNVKTAADNAQAAANNAQNTADSKMDAENPVGTGSFSIGRKSDTSVGTQSFAVGYDVTAEKPYSHAEGYCTFASGEAAHAEGAHTHASGYNAHAEGINTRANGRSAHAEGASTTASASFSHAEGRGTTASNLSQHVQGEYNKVDPYGAEDERGKYAHIVGNGTKDNARSNAHTLDWDGVPWYQGRPQFGGNAQDDGAQIVMANGDTEIILASSTADSTKKFKITVDDSGTLTATEVTE